MSQNTEDKLAVAQSALTDLIPRLKPDTTLGIGTGSTVNCFIDCLEQYRDCFAAAVATSRATAERLAQKKIPVVDLKDANVEIYIDGADEVDPELRLIKGGGGALTLEKIVASVASEFICIADASKSVDQLGTFPLPVEVLAQAGSLVVERLADLGGQTRLRDNYKTDLGNQILTVTGLDYADPAALESRINDIPGVVCCGIFAHRKADVLHLGTARNVSTLTL